TWELYERRELIELVDISLNGEFDAEEACKFLKIGLLCTQSNPKIRPSMSCVVKMLTGEMDVDESNLTKPGLISDFMDLNIREQNSNDIKTSSSSKDTTISLPASGAENTTVTVNYDQSF
ncbi:hypothetical protein S245_043884, partial [Arachis hypogaea]